MHVPTLPKRVLWLSSRPFAMFAAFTVAVFGAAGVMLLGSQPAAAATVIDGCTIVAGPSPTSFTNCPGMNLSGADLEGIDLSYANLHGADLASADIGGAIFQDANLSNANLSGAFFASSGDCTTTVSGTTVTGGQCPVPMDFESANLAFANLSSAVWCEVGPPICEPVDLSNADLTAASMPGCFLWHSNFTATHFNYAHMSGCSLLADTIAGTEFFRTDLTDTTWSASSVTKPSDLAGADLAGAQLGSSSIGAVPLGSSKTISFPGADLSEVNLSYANLTGASFAGTTSLSPTAATLLGTDLTGTILVPADQTNSATSASGASVSWPASTALPGATPQGCNRSPGSTFPIGTTIVSCYVTDSAGNQSAGSFTVTVTDTPPTTAVLQPYEAATVSGSIWLAASAGSMVGLRTVQFALSGGVFEHLYVAIASPTPDGWLASFDTTTVPNGTYSIQSVATDTEGVVTWSAPVSFTVSNHPLTTRVLVPTSGATIANGSILDASAQGLSSVYSVTFTLSGGALSTPVEIATAVNSAYGWIALANVTGIAPGTYDLESNALDSGGESATSPPVTVTVG